MSHLTVGLYSERAAVREVDPETAQAKLARAWEEIGPCDHAYEVLYRRNAEALVARALAVFAKRP